MQDAILWGGFSVNSLTCKTRLYVRIAKDEMIVRTIKFSSSPNLHSPQKSMQTRVAGECRGMGTLFWLGKVLVGKQWLFRLVRFYPTGFPQTHQWRVRLCQYLAIFLQ